jgi:hypothetical protein
MTRRRFAAAVMTLGVAALLASVPPRTQAADGRKLEVPADYATLEEAIAASAAGDIIVLAPGTYAGDIEVPPEKAGITIHGEDRNTVVFDGANTRKNAIEVEADNVTLENMSAHDFVENGFYWDGVEGFAGRYLTVWNVGLYAIYAIQSRNGVIEHSYASGAADAAFYIGECNPCDTVVRDVTAALSAVGYSGTNAGGNLVIEDSRFENNSIGILPNSFEVGLQPPPQRDATFRNNVVTGSGSVPTPRVTPLGGFHGIGIGVAGGVGNVVEGNEVSGSTRYGIAVFTAIDLSANWVPRDNRISGNTITTSTLADLALAGGSGGNNCFENNTVTTTAPEGLTGCSLVGAGDADVAAEIVIPPPRLLQGLPPAPDYATMPAPEEQPNMCTPGTPGATCATDAFIPGLATVITLVVAGIVVVVLLAAYVFARRTRSRTPGN